MNMYVVSVKHAKQKGLILGNWYIPRRLLRISLGETLQGCGSQNCTDGLCFSPHLAGHIS